MPQPDVSVIMPTYNRREFTAEAVASALDQGPINMEVIVVDDGSSDGSREAIQADFPQIQVLTQEHQGACVARNRGMAAASGRFIKFLDSDDKLAPNTVAGQVEALEASGGQVLYGDFEIFGDLADPRVAGVPVRVTGTMPEDPVTVLLGEWFCAPFTYLYRAEAVKDLCWAVELECLQDVDWNVRVAQCGYEFEYHAGIAGYYRVHGDQITSSSHLRYAVNRCRILDRVVGELTERGEMTDPRRLIIAHGYWNAARAYYRHAPERFQGAVDQVRALEPGFRPRLWGAWPVRTMTGLLGIEKTEALLAARRSLAQRIKTLFGSRDQEPA